MGLIDQWHGIGKEKTNKNLIGHAKLNKRGN